MPPIKDYSNQIFNSLTGVRFSCRRNNTSYWIFRCICGIEKEISISNVLNSQTKSCGCQKYKNKKGIFKNTKFGNRGHRFIDLSGKKFNRLTVVSFFKMNKDNKALWKCVCDCGTETVIIGKSVSSGKTKSCGCLWVESISLPKGAANLNRQFAQYQSSASKRNLEFELSIEHFEKLINSKCAYCGSAPHNRTRGKNTITTNGIDRIDNNKGYTIENSTPCCKLCNISKASLTVVEFLDMIKKIYINMELFK